MAHRNSFQIKNSAKKSRSLAKNIYLALIIILLLAIFIIGGFWAAHLLRQRELNDNNDLDVDPIELLGLEKIDVTDAEKDNYVVAPDKPRYLSIPKIGVDRARILEIGVSKPNDKGIQQMDAPNTTADVGWYNCAKNPIAEKRCGKPKIPGDGNVNNAAVIDGHTCFSNTVVCVFDKLKDLRNGDSLTVEMGDGTILNYVVKKVEIKELADVDMSKVMKPIESGQDGLNFISCAGKYQGARDSSGVLTASQRVLVYAILVN